MRHVVAPDGSDECGVLRAVQQAADGLSCSTTGEPCGTKAEDGEGGAVYGSGSDGRGCSMSAAMMIVPMIWATAAVEPELLIEVDVEQAVAAPMLPEAEEEESAAAVAPEMAFYRKYTEGMLRRYLRMAMEAGKTPSLLGKEMFRGRVTSYKMTGFDDAVIFVHDVEKCIGTLGLEQQELIERIALQEYTHDEVAEMQDLPRRTILRRYEDAVDNLTAVFLRVKLLEPMSAAQEAGSVR